MLGGPPGSAHGGTEAHAKGGFCYPVGLGSGWPAEGPGMLAQRQPGRGERWRELLFGDRAPKERPACTRMGIVPH